jgi:hypothetical protein
LETSAPGDKREIMVHLFYPADPNRASARAAYVPDAEVMRGPWNDEQLARITAMRAFSLLDIARCTSFLPLAPECSRILKTIFRFRARIGIKIPRTMVRRRRSRLDLASRPAIVLDRSRKRLATLRWRDRLRRL